MFPRCNADYDDGVKKDVFVGLHYTMLIIVLWTNLASKCCAVGETEKMLELCVAYSLL
jgi:hypothetical protein